MSFLSKATLHFFSRGEQWDEQFLFKTVVRYRNLPLISGLISASSKAVLEGLIPEGTYNRNRKKASKQVKAVPRYGNSGDQTIFAFVAANKEGGF